MARIVTTTHRYKPPPKRKGRKKAEITGPAVVVGKGSRRPVWERGGGRSRVRSKSTRLEKAGEAQPTTPPERQRDPVVTTARKAPAPANNDGPRRSVIVAARKHRSWRSDVPEMTEEERPTR